MNVIPKPFPNELAELRGLSPTLMRSHHENTYLGAVRRLNSIRAALSSVDFVVTLQRGTQWAATGQVTQKVPGNFPTANSVSYRSDLAAMDPDYKNGLDNLDLPRR